ncbi:MAG: helix-turn-helix domain-containing protein [Desulfovibrio sp.]|jgi:transposase|nr:helix-turn-helix domain-containing protein [Desulfovibrio sp.]
MKTASTETRDLVVKAYTSGIATRKQLAEIFGYHIQSIGNWIRQYEREGRITPHAKGHRKSVFTDEEKRQLAELFKNNTDITLRELRELFDKSCSLVAIHKTVVKLGLVFKKNSTRKRTGARRYNPKAE